MVSVSSVSNFLLAVVLAATLSGCNGKITAKSWKLEAESDFEHMLSRSHLLYLKGRDEALVFGTILTGDKKSRALFVSQLKGNNLGKLAVLSSVAHIIDIVLNPADDDSVLVLSFNNQESQTFLGVLKVNGDDDYNWQSFKVQTHTRPILSKIVTFDDFCVVGGDIEPTDYAFLAFDLKKTADLDLLWAKRQRMDWKRVNATDEFRYPIIAAMNRVGDNTLIVASTVFAEANLDICAFVLCSYQVSREGITENWCRLRPFDDGYITVFKQMYVVDTGNGNAELVVIGYKESNTYYKNIVIEHIRISDGILTAAYYWPTDVQTSVPNAMHYALGTANPILEVGCHMSDIQKASVWRYDVNAQQLAEVLVWDKTLYVDVLAVSSTNKKIYAGENVDRELVAMTSTDCFDEHIVVEPISVNGKDVTALSNLFFAEYGINWVSANFSLEFTYVNTALSNAVCTVETTATTTETPFTSETHTTTSTKKAGGNGGHHNGSSLSGRALAGIIIGILGAVLILAMCVCYAQRSAVLKQEPYLGLETPDFELEISDVQLEAPESEPELFVPVTTAHKLETENDIF